MIDNFSYFSSRDNRIRDEGLVWLLREMNGLPNLHTLSLNFS